MSDGLMEQDWGPVIHHVRPQGKTDLPTVLEALSGQLSAAVAVVGADEVLATYACPSDGDEALLAAAHGDGIMVSFGSDDMYNLARGRLDATGADLLVGRIDHGFTDDERIAIATFAHVLDLGLAVSPRRSAGPVASLEEVFHHSDTLTGLLTRDSFVSYLEAAIPAHEDADSVLVLGLDGFKIANDTLGYATGDVVLQTIASRIMTCVREGDIAARLGGDVFAIYSPGIGSDLATDVARRIQQAINQRIPVGESDIMLTASVGVATSWDNDPADVLIAHADTAMRAAKREGQGHVVAYDDSLHFRVQLRRNLAAELQTAIAENQLRTVLEPIVSTGDFSIVGQEARVRWQHPLRGPVDADEFMNLAVDIGRVGDVERAVFTFALEERIRDAELPPIAVNLSASSLLDDHHVDWMLEQLSLLGVDGSAVMVEIPEGAVHANPERARSQLRRLHEVGVGVILDEFGAAVTSIRSFHDFPFDGVKIHRSLFADTTEVQNEAMMRTIYASADVLGFDIIHVGIDTQDELAALEALAPRVGREVLYVQGAVVQDRLAA